jgi:hypothetical protein
MTKLGDKIKEYEEEKGHPPVRIEETESREDRNLDIKRCRLPYNLRMACPGGCGEILERSLDDYYVMHPPMKGPLDIVFQPCGTKDCEGNDHMNEELRKVQLHFEVSLSPMPTEED